jgi:phosphoglycerol transferase
MDHAPKSKQYPTILYYLSSAFLPIVILWLFVDISNARFDVPMVFFGDTLENALRVKAFQEGSWSDITRLSAPFSYNLFMYPLLSHVDYGLACFAAFISGDYAVSLFIGWLLKIMLGGLIATWCFRRLKISAPVALVSGLLFALIPYALSKSVIHYNLSIYLVPLPVTFCLLVLQGRYASLTKGQKWVFIVGALLIGFNGTYTVFFSLFTLCVTLVGVAFKREWLSIKPLATLSAIMLTAALINSAPSFLALRNAEYARDVIAEEKSKPDYVNTYGLRIRDLLVPTYNNYLTPLNEFHETMREEYPSSREANDLALGLFGSFGFLALLIMGLMTVTKNAQADTVRFIAAPAAYIVFCCLLLGMVGGFSNFLALPLLDTAPLRSFYRISTVIAYCSFYSTALLLDRGIARVNVAKFTTNSTVAYCVLALVAFLGIQDQVHVRDWNRDWMRSKWVYDELEPFVSNIEERLPENAMVYQYPDKGLLITENRKYSSSFPHLYAYLLSDDIRWSYAHHVRDNQGHAWHFYLNQFGPADMASILLIAGFDGVWFDTLDSTVDDQFMAPFLTLPYSNKLVSTSKRYVFVDLTWSRKAVIQNMGEKNYFEAQGALLGNPNEFLKLRDSFELNYVN